MKEAQSEKRAARGRRTLVRIVDDEDEVAAGLAFLLSCADIDCVRYASAEAFLAGDDPSAPGCILLDIRMPGMSGLALQRVLAEHGSTCQPVIFITGHADVEMAVTALKAGAADFLQKPVDEARLLEAIAVANARSLQLFSGKPSREELASRFGALSAREREIVQAIQQGMDTAEIAERFRISARTVQAHRLSIYRKLGVNSVEDIRALGKACASASVPAALRK